MRTKVSFRVIFIDRNGNEYPDYLCNEYDEAKEQAVFDICNGYDDNKYIGFYIEKTDI